MEIQDSNLNSHVMKLEVQANKYFHLKLQKDVLDKKLSRMQVEMIQRQKSIRKLKTKTARYRKDISDKSSSLKKMEHHLKKIWSLLLVLGNKLRKNGLLTVEEKDKLRNEYEEWFTLLVSQERRNTEEVFNMLNDLPISLFEVLNDSDYSIQTYNSKLNTEHFNKKQNLLSTSNKELSSENQTNDSSSKEFDTNHSFVTSPKLSTSELSDDHNLDTLPSVSDGDSETDSDTFDNDSFELNADVSNNHLNKELAKSILNEPLKLASDQNKLDMSCNLDQSDTESCDENDSEATTYDSISENTDGQEVSVNTNILPNNLQTGSTSSQMSLIDSSNISTLCSSSHNNLKSLDSISKKNSVSSENLIDISKSDSTNNSFGPSKILHDTLRVQDRKISKKKITQQSKKKFAKKVYDNCFDRNKNKSMLLSKTSPSLPRDKSLDYNYPSKENTLVQNESAKKDPSKVTRTTIMLPGPPLKISRKSKQCLTVKEDSELKDASHPQLQNLSSVSSIKRVQQFSSCNLESKKKPRANSNKSTSDIAPVRVRGRTLISRGTLRKKNIEFDGIGADNECGEEYNEAHQTLRSESEAMVDQSIPEDNFVPPYKPKKIRKEHKGNLTKDNFKNGESIDKVKLTYEENKNSTTNKTKANFHKNVPRKSEKNKNDVSDLLKEAESSKTKTDPRLQSLSLFKYFKLKAKDRKQTNINILKTGLFKRGITRFQKPKAFISNINKSNCTDTIHALGTKEEFTCSVNRDFDETKSHAAYKNQKSEKELPFIISENEIQTDLALQNIQEKSAIITSGNVDSDTVSSESFTVMKDNSFLDSEVPSSIENVNISPIERKSIQCDVKCNSDDKSVLVTAKDLDFKEDISENNSDFEGTLVIDEKLDNAKSINHSSSPEQMEVDDFDEKYISTGDSDFESPLVIDENFVVEQNITSEEKQDKNKISKNEYNDYLNCINVSKNIEKEYNPLVCTQNASNFSNNCATSTANKDSEKEMVSSGNVKDESVSSQNTSSAQSLTSIKFDIGVKSKAQIEKCLNEHGNQSPACKKEDLKCCDKTFFSEKCTKLKSKEIDFNQEIIEKGAQEENSSTPLCSSKSNKNVKKKRKLQEKIKKRKRPPKNNPCVVTKSVPEKFFEEFRKIEFSEENFKQNTKKLFNFLINPSHFPNNFAVLFQVLNYLQNTKKNPLLTYSVNGDSSVLFPLDENCIVSTLFMIESKKKLNLDGLLRTSVTTMHHLIISSKKFGIYGLASLCRVFTAICKEEGDNLKPVILCGDLLKMKHQFAPYLIASVAGVWKELFQVDSNVPAEEFLFHSCILYGASKRPKQLVECNWKSSIEFISKYFTALPVNNTRSAIHMLKELINARCEDDTWNNQYVSSAMIILACYENWEWTEENLLTGFIIPNLNNYGREALNKNAFDLFCNLYVETFLLSPGNPLDTVLIKFFNSSTNQDDNFVRDSAALALMKFVYKKNRKLPSFLNSWFELNKDNPKVKLMEPYYETSMVERLSVSQERYIL